MILNEYGWDSHFDEALNKFNDSELIPARIVADYGQSVRVIAQDGEIDVQRRIHEERAFGVGDFVALRYSTENYRYFIEHLLPRKTMFSRVAAGQVLKEQIVAANIDWVFIMQSLNHDFNMRRLERYLIAAWESGAMPVVVLTKSDLCDDVDAKVNEAFQVAVGANIHAVSAVNREGLDELKSYFGFGKTVALMGSSGVGKSTLVNVMAGKEILKTQEVMRDDDRGRHTTTHRELVLLPDGGLVMDTPGMRTMGMRQADAGMESIFGDIEELAAQCRFRDCAHEREPGCAVKAALEDGTLEGERWASYKKLKKEMAHLERKKDQKLRMHDRQFTKMIKGNKKESW